MEAGFCIDCLQETLCNPGKPEIFNSEQGSQPSYAFTGVLQREGSLAWTDGEKPSINNFVDRLWRNVKHEDVYLKGYAAMGELTTGFAEYFAFYNEESPLQSLCNITPDVVYRTVIGGVAASFVYRW